MNISNVKNSMYRGFTYTNNNSNTGIIMSELNGTYLMCICELKENSGHYIVESIGSQIISIKNISDNIVNVLADRENDTIYFDNVSKVTINYFSPSNIIVGRYTVNIDGVTSNKYTVVSKTIYFDTAITSDKSIVGELDVENVITSSIKTNEFNIGKWNVSKGSNDSVITITWNDAA